MIYFKQKEGGKNKMPVKVELTIEQIAETLRHMKKAELETLEILLDAKTEKKILKRQREARAGKTIPMSKMSSFKNL
jgi:predicted transcriptional regulator